MKIKNFEYKKKKDGQVKKYLLMLLDEDNDHIGGIDFTKLDQEEIDQIIEIQSNYERELTPFVKKAYRKYIKENIINDNTITDPQQLSNS